MVSYIIAGKADDPTFAFAEYAAKLVQQACPNIFFHYEMKHPDEWKDFINAVFRKYDFNGYGENFSGSLVWTHEGELIGTASEFVQNIVVEKYGIRDFPQVNDQIFVSIAAANHEQVQQQQLRQQRNGPSLVELCGAAALRANNDGLIVPPIFCEKRKKIIKGTTMEVWVSQTIEEERQQLRQDYGSGQPACISSGLVIGPVGEDSSHLAVLHPKPLSQKHLVMIPQRLAQEAEGSSLTVQPHSYRDTSNEDLSQGDFLAAFEIIEAVGGIATWMGIRGGEEYRHPLDTHMQVLPFPLSSEEGSPLRYPLELALELYADRSSSKANALDFFAFRHFYFALDSSNSPEELASTALSAYRRSKGKKDKDQACALAFTPSWMLIVPLVPPQPGTARHEAWVRFPPPPPCALCGVVICPSVQQEFPETLGHLAGGESRLITNRAEEENIPEGCAEYDVASRDVRIAGRILDMPAEIVGEWALPL